MAGAFTGKGYEKGFNHKLIAGDHVSDGVRYNGYPCERNTGAFVYYNGHYYFLYLHYIHELDLAARGKGMGVAQEMIIHNGLLLQTTRDDVNQNKFRALCEIDDALCVVEPQKPISYGAYKDCLQALRITEALYLDMGGWSYSWYRDEAGELHRRFPNNREFLTNALVFVGSK
ncbi:MAG: hypothetical protein MJ211_14005 [Bacteroidales bacterium]|nr:hypothetical protein [Bacteroidales bacterium]